MRVITCFDIDDRVNSLLSYFGKLKCDHKRRGNIFRTNAFSEGLVYFTRTGYRPRL